MITFKIKLQPNVFQTQVLTEWFAVCAEIWNWSIRKLDRDALDGVYYGSFAFTNILAGHPQRLGMPNVIIQGMLNRAWKTWMACRKKNKGVAPSKWARVKFKNRRRRVNSISLMHPGALRLINVNHIKVTKLGVVRFRSGQMPVGRIKGANIMREPSGFYLALVIDAQPRRLACKRGEMVGIDPGFKDILNLSTGEKLNGPTEIEAAIEKTEDRLRQAHRGRDYQLMRRLSERLMNQKKHRNHILSKEIVQRFETIVYGVDNEAQMAKKVKYRDKNGRKIKKRGFGASVNRATHYQIREMIEYKAVANEREYIEVPGRNTTIKCSKCLKMSGPTGFESLKTRKWVCANCGEEHDRDTNAAINVLQKAFLPNAD